MPVSRSEARDTESCYVLRGESRLPRYPKRTRRFRPASGLGVFGTICLRPLPSESESYVARPNLKASSPTLRRVSERIVPNSQIEQPRLHYRGGQLLHLLTGLSGLPPMVFRRLRWRVG
jgi:hypothetical protein